MPKSMRSTRRMEGAPRGEYGVGNRGTAWRVALGRVRPVVGPPEALRVLTWQDSGEDPAETLAAVAVAMQLDLVFVPARVAWANDAVRSCSHADVASAWAVSGVWDALPAARLGERACAIGERTRSAGVRSLRCTARCAGRGPSRSPCPRRRAGRCRRPGRPVGVARCARLRDGGLVPCYRQLAAQADVPAIFHSDGDVRALYASLSQAGFSAVHVAVPGEGAIERAVQAARDAGLVPVGGIEASALLASGASKAGMRAGALAAVAPWSYVMTGE